MICNITIIPADAHGWTEIYKNPLSYPVSMMPESPEGGGGGVSQAWFA